MGKVMSDRMVVAIDVGTTKICVLVGNILGDGMVEVVGVGSAPSDGLRKGVVVDIARAIKSIKQAVEEAQLDAGCQITAAYVGVAGGHIQSFNSHGVVPIARGQVSNADVTNVLAAAKAVPIEEGRQILHVLPQFFVIDGTERVINPLDMHGVRLESQVHIVTGSVASVQNIIQCCTAAGVQVIDVILEQLASAHAVLTEDEKELGVGMLDIGGGTADLALFQRGGIRHTMVLPVAGNHFTSDVAIGARTSLAEAERIKCQYGTVLDDDLTDDFELIELETVGGQQRRTLTKRELVRMLKPRAQELLALINRDIKRLQLRPMLTSGLVLTGGGSLLAGMAELAARIFSVPVRIGRPKSRYSLPESLCSPIYSTAYGLLVHAMKQQSGSPVFSEGTLATRILERMRSWVADFF